jgi:hypothetical protein
MGNTPASSQRAGAYPVMIMEAPEIGLGRAWLTVLIDSTSHHYSCSPRASPPATRVLWPLDKPRRVAASPYAVCSLPMACGDLGDIMGVNGVRWWPPSERPYPFMKFWPRSVSSSPSWHHSAFDLVTVIHSKSINEWRRPV